MFKRRRSLFSPGPIGTILAMIALVVWALVVLFPLYWVFITSFKLPIDVFSGPFYIPFVDFKPSLDAWHYILLGDLQRDTFRPYLSTIVVSISSTILALVFGSAAAYALTRFTYRPKLGAVGIFIGCLLLVIVAVSVGVPWLLAVVVGVVLFLILLQTVARRFTRSLGNNDIAFWMITQRILPPVAVVIPFYIFFQRLGMLDTWASLIITYVAANMPIVVWLMRDYFQSVPIELEECASIDGASRYRTFWSIVLPLSLPGLVATFLFVLVFAWNEYLFALFLTSANAQTLPLTIAAQNATRGPQWWYMSVLILIMIIPVIAMAIALERYIASGLLIGAIKG